MENTVELEWRSSECEPALIREPILCQTKKKNLVVFKNTMGWKIGKGQPESNWETLRTKYNIEWWTYVQEIVI